MAEIMEGEVRYHVLSPRSKPAPAPRRSSSKCSTLTRDKHGEHEFPESARSGGRNAVALARLGLKHHHPLFAARGNILAIARPRHPDIY
jgi:hypothetical protein